ncbi:MAG: mechanosensitive ion channel family protein, partial [Ardenticatenaceae bacterium]
MIEISLGGVIVIAAASVGFVVLCALLWWLIPRFVVKLLRALDSMVLLEVAGYGEPISRGLFVIAFVILLASLIFTVLTQIGVNTDGVQAAARSNGAAVGKWLGPKVLRTLLIVALTLLALRLINRFAPKLVRLLLRGRTESEAARAEVEKRAQTLDGVVKWTFGVFIILIAAFTLLSLFGVPIGPVLAGVGIAGLAIGFGAQSFVKDVISGTFILIEDQYRVGDVVQVAGTSGLVEDINLRRTVLRDLDFIQHFIPNGEITVASNFTKERSRVNLDIRVAYRSDLDHVISVLNRAGEELSQDEYFGPLITDQIKVLRVDSFDESGITIKMLGETLPIRQWETAGEFRKRIKKVFDQEGIEIPLPHRTLYWGNNVETKVLQLIEDSEKRKDGQE